MLPDLLWKYLQNQRTCLNLHLPFIYGAQFIFMNDLYLLPSYFGDVKQQYFSDLKAKCTIPGLSINKMVLPHFFPRLIWKKVNSYLRNFSQTAVKQVISQMHMWYISKLEKTYFSACPQASPLHRMSVTTQEELRS